MKLRVDKGSVAKFLEDFKKLASTSRLVFQDRKKNLDSLAKLGLKKINAKHEILALCVEDYCGELKLDYSDSTVLWRFGKIIDGKAVYTKLKIVQDGNVRRAICVSFHLAEFDLCFPYQ